MARCSLNTRSLLTCSTERQSLRTWPLVDLDAATELAAVAYPSRRAVLLSARLFDPSAGHLLARCPPAARSLAPAPCRGRPHWPLPISAATLLTFGEVRRVGRAIRTLRGDQVRAMARSLCFFGCCTTISSFLGLHGYGHPSPRVGVAAIVHILLNNCTSFPDTTFWTVSAQSLPFLYGHLSPRVGLATSVLKPLNNCTRFPDTLFQTVSGSPLRAGCTQARPSVVIPWPFWGASLVEMAWSSARMASAVAGSTPGVASRRSVPPHALLTAAASGASRQRRQREKRAFAESLSLERLVGAGLDVRCAAFHKAQSSQRYASQCCWWLSRRWWGAGLSRLIAVALAWKRVTVMN